MAYTVASLSQLGAGLWFLQRRLGFLEGRRILTTAARAAAAAFVMALGVYAASQATGARVDLGSGTGRLLQVGAGILVGTLLYGGFAMAFRLEEVRFVKGLFARPRAASAHGRDAAPAEHGEAPMESEVPTE